ncbi:MAG: hypothetical protein Q8M07_23960 [Prosthecobacter sp.]|nr:hypothetical protein [Prosthecobacter sp.]
MSKRDQKSKAHHSVLDQLWFAMVLLAVITGIVTFIWWKVPQILGEGLNPPDNKGSFGDSFGSVNALFTGLAFTGVVFSILLQQRQIRLQREDFLSQLKEMQESGETLRLQNDLLENQNQLMRGQIEVQLLQIEARALEMECTVNELQVTDWIPHSSQRGSLLDGITQKANSLRTKVGKLQCRLFSSDEKPGPSNIENKNIQ